MNIPKVVNENVPLFNSINNDLFSRGELEASNNNQIKKAISKLLEAATFQHEPNLFGKLFNFEKPC
jgi:hypothetical protein